MLLNNPIKTSGFIANNISLIGIEHAIDKS